MSLCFKPTVKKPQNLTSKSKASVNSDLCALAADQPESFFTFIVVLLDSKMAEVQKRHISDDGTAENIIIIVVVIIIVIIINT